MNLRFLERSSGFVLILLLQLVISYVAKGQIIDKIIAKVDNQIILKSEFETAYLQFKQQSQLHYGTDEEVKCSVIETLVINKLLLAKAEIDSVTVDKETVDAELDRRMDHMIAQAGGDPKKIEQYFNKSLDQLKSEVRKSIKEQLIIQKMQEKISGKIKVTPKEVSTFFSEIPKDSLPYFSTEIETGQIVKVPQITRSQKLQAKAKAEEIRERLMKGEDFCKLAEEHSEDPGSAKACGEIGFFAKGNLVAPYEAAALSLKTGEISPITESEYGYHIIQLIERRGNEFNSRHILIKPTSTSESISDAYRFLDSIRTRILMDSLTFEKAAHEFSDDKETQGNGGLFVDRTTGSTKIPLENLDPGIFFIVDTMHVGQITMPISYTLDEAQAVRIIYYKTKIPPHQANLKDDYQKIYKAALEEKKNNAVNEWFDKNKQEVFIDIDPEYMNCKILSSQ